MDGQHRMETNGDTSIKVKADTEHKSSSATKPAVDRGMRQHQLPIEMEFYMLEANAEFKIWELEL